MRLAEEVRVELSLLRLETLRQWDEFQPQPKLFWLGRQFGPKEIQCAEWCHQAEQYVLQNLHAPKQGRGWYLALELKPLPPTKPLTPWKNGDLAYWGQFCSLLYHVASKGFLGPSAMVHLKAKTADLELRWQDIHGKRNFREAMEILLTGDGKPLTLLIKGAEANKDFAKKVNGAASSSQWHLSKPQSTRRSSCAAFSEHPCSGQDRQTNCKWGERERERERLRWEAVQQARRWEDLDPHDAMKKLRKLPQKACGPDGIRYALLKNLPIESVTDLRSMFRKAAGPSLYNAGCVASQKRRTLSVPYR